MTSLAIFLASLVVVFALGVQQLNVNEGRRAWAFATSIVIGLATLVQLKLLPGPTTLLDICGYLLGSAIGIVASMWAYPRLFRSNSVTGHSPNSVALGDTVRLATEIADYSARADIEGFCRSERVGSTTWWDTSDRHLDDELDKEFVRNAVTYLLLRRKVRAHASKPHLLTFT